MPGFTQISWIDYNLYPLIITAETLTPVLIFTIWFPILLVSKIGRYHAGNYLEFSNHFSECNTPLCGDEKKSRTVTEPRG